MIHGTGHIVIKSGTTELEIKKVKLLKDTPIPKLLRSESELTNEVDIYSMNDRHILQFRYHIYKYGAGSVAKYRELWAWKDAKVKFRFYAGNYFKDMEGNEADYFLSMKKNFWDSPDYKDIIILTFESLKTIDFAASALPEKTIFSHVQDNYYPNVDSDGNIMTYSEGVI